MVSALWLLPLAVAAAAIWPLLVATGRLATELDALHTSVARLADVGPALAVLRDEASVSLLSIENLPLR